MRTAERYDAVCVGGTFSAYLSAALLSKAGCKVLLIDEQEACSPHDVDGRTVFDPDLSPLWGVHYDNPLSRHLKSLGMLSDGTDMPFVECKGLSQVINPLHRLHISYDKTQALREIDLELQDHGVSLYTLFDLFFRVGEELPLYSSRIETVSQMSSQELNRVLRFWGELGPSAIGKRMISFQKAFNSHGGMAEAFLSALLSTLAPVSPKYIGVEQGLRVLSVAMQGQVFWKGGMDSLKKSLLRIALENGGDMVVGAQVKGLVQEKSRIRGILLSSYDGAVFADYTILTTHLKSTYATLPATLKDRSVVKNLEKAHPSHWRYTLAVSLNKEVIPVGATEFMTYIGSYKLELEEENLLRIIIVPEKVYPESDSPDTVTVHVTAFVPYHVSSLSYSYLRRLGGKMLHALAEIIPFFEYNVASIYPDIRKGEEDLRRLYPFDRPQWVPENLLIYHTRGGQEVQDFWGTSWATPHENLYFGGRTVMPSLGCFGEALVADKIINDLLFPRRRDAATPAIFPMLKAKDGLA